MDRLDLRPDNPKVMAIPSRGRRARTMQGVTLIELILALSIAAALTAMAGPEVGRTLRRARLEADAHTLLSALEDARSTARSLMVPVSVRIDGTALVLTSSLTPARRFELGRSVARMDFDTASDTIVFNTRGGLDQTAPVSLSAETRADQTWSFVIYPAIGAVRRQ